MKNKYINTVLRGVIAVGMTGIIVSLSFGLSAKTTNTAPAGNNITVTLLGTGSPVLSAERFGPSTLVEAGEQKFLFDAGRGASIRLGQLADPRVIMPKIRHVFFTHLHSDHLMGLSDLYMTGWLYERNQPFHVYGPVGTAQMMADMRKTFQEDVKFRSPAKQDKTNPTEGLTVVALDFDKDRVVFEQDGVKVTAFSVDHGPIKPSFGYKVEYAGKSVVISGDTNYSTNLINYSKGVDLIIHEVAQASAQAIQAFPNMKKILSVHTTPQDAGRVFAETKPKLAVYNHILLFNVSAEELVTQTKETYTGDVRVGHDLMKIIIAEQVTVVNSPK